MRWIFILSNPTPFPPLPFVIFAVFGRWWPITTEFKGLCRFLRLISDLCYEYVFQISSKSDNICLFYSISLIFKMAAAAILENGRRPPLLHFFNSASDFQYIYQISSKSVCICSFYCMSLPNQSKPASYRLKYGAKMLFWGLNPQFWGIFIVFCFQSCLYTSNTVVWCKYCVDRRMLIFTHFFHFFTKPETPKFWGFGGTVPPLLKLVKFHPRDLIPGIESHHLSHWRRKSDH